MVDTCATISKNPSGLSDPCMNQGLEGTEEWIFKDQKTVTNKNTWYIYCRFTDKMFSDLVRDDA